MASNLPFVFEESVEGCLGELRLYLNARGWTVSVRLTAVRDPGSQIVTIVRSGFDRPSKAMDFLCDGLPWHACGELLELSDPEAVQHLKSVFCLALHSFIELDVRNNIQVN